MQCFDDVFFIMYTGRAAQQWKVIRGILTSNSFYHHMHGPRAVDEILFCFVSDLKCYVVVNPRVGCQF